MHPDSDHSHTRFALTFDDGYESVYSQVLPLLDTYGFSASVFMVAGYIGKKPSWDVYSHGRHLSAVQLRELSERGIEIGSHSLTHPDLTRLSDNDLVTELSESKKRLEDCLGIPISSISFPFGSWNTRVWAFAQRCGYAYACAYRDHRWLQSGMCPAYGVYSFESPESVLEKALPRAAFSPARTVSVLGAQGARLTPLLRFRNAYHTTPHIST
jgi:peptidoglycan/xylan/chitin deacetylase (PgdA/CDA1 family)